MSARLPLRGAVAGIALALLAGCAAPTPLPTTTAAPLDPAPDAPVPSFELELLVGEIAQDARAVWNGYLASRGAAVPEVEIVVLQPGEEHPAACVGAETDPLVSSDDLPTGIPCADGTATVVVPLEPLTSLEDFAVAFLVARAYGSIVSFTFGETGGELVDDCLGGVWAAVSDRRRLLEEGDVEEALALLADDDARTAAFLQGFEGMPGLDRGDADECRHSFGG